MPMLEAACAAKLCSLVFTVLAAGSKAFDFEFASQLFEAGDRSGEFAHAFGESHRDAVRRALSRLQKSVNREVELEFGSDRTGERASAEFSAALNAVLPKCLPTKISIAEANLDSSRIADLVLDNAAAADSRFGKDQFGGKLLRRLIATTYEELKLDPAFADLINLSVQEVLLRRTAEQEKLRDIVDRLTRDLSLTQAEKTALAADLARIKAERNGTVELVAGFLATVVGRHVPPEQFSATLFRIAVEWKTAGERIDALSVSRNLSPRLAALKAEAQAAHLAGHLDEANAALAEIDRIETEALDRLEAHEREVQEEVRLRRTGIAATRVAQAANARARLAYREAAEHWRAAARAIAPVDARDEWGYILNGAVALWDLGREFGDNTALVDAIELYRDEALPRAPRERVPLDWAGTQNNLGTALETLGARESGTARLEQAVAAYRAALQEYTRERVPLDWAATQNNLGNALAMLGERESGTARLEQAVAAYREALKERTRERVPLDWATTQNNLGTALSRLGERESGTARLEQAVAAYRAALQERTRERVPLDWAATQNNLGAALATLGERESGTAQLEQAVAAYREALKEYTRERVPLNWAQTQNNLGGALFRMGERESGTARLEQAVAAYRAALEVFTAAGADYYVTHTKANRERALALLDARRQQR